jgi:hypothetical protein
MPQKVFIGDDVCPMMTTWVVYAKQNLAESRQSGESFERLRRERGDPENDDPGR